MLVVTTRVGQFVRLEIGEHHAIIKVLSVGASRVSLGIEAPPEVNIVRSHARRKEVVPPEAMTNGEPPTEARRVANTPDGSWIGPMMVTRAQVREIAEEIVRERKGR